MHFIEGESAFTAPKVREIARELLKDENFKVQVDDDTFELLLDLVMLAGSLRETPRCVGNKICVSVAMEEKCPACRLYTPLHLLTQEYIVSLYDFCSGVESKLNELEELGLRRKAELKELELRQEATDGITDKEPTTRHPSQEDAQEAKGQPNSGQG